MIILNQVTSSLTKVALQALPHILLMDRSSLDMVFQAHLRPMACSQGTSSEISPLTPFNSKILKSVKATGSSCKISRSVQRAFSGKFMKSRMRVVLLIRF